METNSAELTEEQKFTMVLESLKEALHGLHLEDQQKEIKQ